MLIGMTRRSAVSLLAATPAAAQRKPVVVVGSIMHESNSFNPAKTELADFSIIPVGPSITDRWAKGSTEVAGFIEGGIEAGFDLRPALYATATPKGPVTREAFEKLTADLIAAIGKTPNPDAVYLALHGAMYADDFPQGDEEIVRRVRQAIGSKTPLVVTHDFHANIPPSLADLCDVLVVYKQNPHLDTKDRGAQVARILRRWLAGEVKPVQAIVKPPMIYNIIHQNTYAEPFKALTDASIELERGNPKILAASVTGGYQYNDCPWIGPAIVVVADGDRDLARREAERLSALMVAQQDRLKLNLPDAEAAVGDAMKGPRFPVTLFDTGDNVGGGSAADSTFLLEEFLKQKAEGWVIVLYDPEAVAAAKKAGVDGDFDLAVGGKSDSAHGQPVPIRGKVRSIHAGRYIEPAVRHGGGRYWDNGHCAVIEAQGSTPDLQNLVVVTARRNAPMSLHQIVSLGIYPERQKILVAKGTVAPRAAYEPVSARIVLVDTPGATSVNPARFDFKRVRSGVWGMR
jgi:microcystin degradation protein MlrC